MTATVNNEQSTEYRVVNNRITVAQLEGWGPGSMPPPVRKIRKKIASKMFLKWSKVKKIFPCGAYRLDFALKPPIFSARLRRNKKLPRKCF